MINVVITQLDPINLKIDCDDRTYMYALRDFFSVYKPNFQHMPAFKSGVWNGKVEMFRLVSRRLAYGLYPDFLKFHMSKYSQTHQLVIPDSVKTMFSPPPMKINYDLKFSPRPYQQDIIETLLSKGKGIAKAPTASGKSLTIAYILKTLRENNQSKKQIIIVPNTTLIKQFQGDLTDYGFDLNDIGLVYAKEKSWEKPLVISTWQSLARVKKNLDLFDTIVVDEVHISKAVEMRKILRKSSSQRFRFGVTGTLPPSQHDMLFVKSYLGPVWREYKNDELAKDDYISKCNIEMIKISYKTDYGKDYWDIRDLTFSNQTRLRTISELVSKSDENILLLVGRIEKEGKILEDFLRRNTDKHVLFLNGSTPIEEREYWRNEAENRKDLAIVATYGIFQVGVNIPSLKYVILAAPFKSKILVLQSIGRALRKHVNKINGAVIYDIVDNTHILSKQSKIRRKYYEEEGFSVNEINIKEDVTPLDQTSNNYKTP